jgi:gliding motility-associated-like protein
MKYLLVIYCLWQSALAGFAQAPVIEWEKSLGGSDHEYGRKIQQTADGGFIVAGITFSNDGHVTSNKGIYDAWLVKLRPDQSIEWQKTFGGSSDDGAYYVEQTTDGGFIMGGFTKSNDGDVPQQKGISDAWFVKTDAAGNIQWSKTYGGTDYEVASVIKQTPDGGYIAAGYCMSGNGDITQPVRKGKQDWWLIKLDANGNKTWDKCYGGSEDEVAYALNLVPGGGYILTGTSRSTDGQVSGGKGHYDIWTVRLDEAGKMLWQKTFGGSSYDNSDGVIPTSDGGFLVAGSSQSNDGDLTGNEGELDAVLIKYDTNGNLLWHSRLGGNKFDDFGAVYEKNGKYWVVGSTESTTGTIKTQYGSSDILLAQFSTAGNVEWTKLYGGSKLDDAFDVMPTNDGGFVLTGSSFSSDNDVKNSMGAGDMWVVKLNAVTPLPIITQQPDSKVGCVQSVASFTITATLSDSYQWQMLNNGAWQNLTNNAKHNGSATLRLDILNVQPDDAQQYRCVVKNSFGETISAAVLLTVQKKPTIAITPIASSVCTGIAVTFTSATTDAGNYFWQKKNGAAWQNTGNGNADYIIAAAALADAGEYRCVAENTCGNMASNTTSLEVTECLLPLIATQPASAAVCISGTASFVVNATRTDSYQWQILNLGTWQPLADNEKYTGSTTEQLQIKDISSGDANQYRCVLRNMFGEAISTVVTLTPKQEPSIQIATENSTVCVGATAKFLATASGAAGYDWQKLTGADWQNVGSSEIVLSIKTSLTDAGSYRCVATNNCGNTISNVLLLDVTDCRIPNAFSPNGDGINDKWAIYFLQNQPESSVRIFNRDGAQVFESQRGYPHFWDGTAHGRALPVGVYYYLISAKSIGQVKGAVTLLR